MLCPSCNKFAAYDTSSEPEVDLDISGDEVTGSVRIVLTSECCGDELKEANFDVNVDVQADLEEAIRKTFGLADDADIDLDDYELSVEEETAEITDRYESTSTRTKKDGTVVMRPIPPRYQKRFFGVALSFKVTAEKDDKTAEITTEFSDEIPASAMDELV